MSQTLPPGLAAAAAEDAGLGAIQRLLRAYGGQGFERYKPSTVRRRVARRMALHGLGDLGAYAALLQGSPAEVELLFQEMLIGVTSFFRDPEVWQLLAQRLLPEIARARPDGTPRRAWCAGCSTGEEAYSLAMTWREAVDVGSAPQRLQIFATDLSAGAIARARHGAYGLDRLDGVSARQRARCFDMQGDLARVKPELREMVLFAQHDLTADPPFGRLDLLICRNLLVYLRSAQQQDLMHLFHHCLRPGGWLVLGNAETAGQAAPLFQALEGYPHVFQRRDGPAAGHRPTPLDQARLAHLLKDPSPMTEPDARPGSLQRQAERVVLERYAPACVLAHRDGDVLWSCGPIARYLEPADGRANVNVLAQARPSLRVWLATALREAPASGPHGVELRGLRMPEAGPRARVDLAVTPFEAATEPPGLNLIVFRDADVDVDAGADPAQSAAPQAGLPPDGPAELAALRDTVRRLRHELQASGEDFQTAHEELQSSHEELTISREEMQSMNEALQALNAELQAKLDALALEQSDMRNLLDSTQIATLFLDAQLNVRRFTEQARQVINLREGDVGRPLSDLTTRLQHPGLVAQAAQVLHTLVPSEQEVPSLDGRWFAVRILPYRTVGDAVAGVVITLTDTTKSDASQRARLARPPASPPSETP